MNNFKKALDDRGITVLEASRTGASYQTLRKHYLGERNVGAFCAIRYEELLGISRSELRPDLWPPSTATQSTKGAQVEAGGGQPAQSQTPA